MARELPEVIPVRLGITTAYLIRQHDVVLVDSGFPKSGEAILRTMQENGINPLDVKLIILTHGHADHAGSAAWLRDQTGASIAIHSGDADKIIQGRQGPLKATGLPGTVFGLFLRGKNRTRFPGLEPDILIKDGMDLEPYGVSGNVITTPGHTPGSVSILLSSNEAIAGDLLFVHLPSGRPGIPFWADDPGEVRRSIRKLMSYNPSRIYLAHGGMIRGEDVRI